MGAVTSLMYGAEDPSIAGMVLDSPFSNLVDLMMELVDTYKYPLPKFTVKLAIQHMRKIVKRKANFDIMDLDTIQVAKRCFVPALFGHATEDDFILPHHSDKIYESYVGDKNIIKFDGDHNSPRPQFYFDSIMIFFHNVLNPPDVPEDHYFLTPHGSLGQGHWDTEHDIEYRFVQSPTGTARATTTEDAIAQLRSRRLMSRMEVPSGATTEDTAERTEGMDSDVGPSSSSVSTATPPSGHNGRLLTPTSDDGEYVEYSFDSLSDMPYTVEDEDRMLMQAILESLKDFELSNTKNASDVASKESNAVKDFNGMDGAALEPDASSVLVCATDAPSKPTTVCTSETKSAEVRSADSHDVNNAASVSASGSSEPQASTQITNGTPASVESQKTTQKIIGEDGTRATLVVQKSRNGGLIDGLTQKWGSFFKNND
uniref:Serine aminopeptidase S33 domain-containing protein n=1 Tax=Arundo donax TaxID=35708 RepID=A0A0A9FET2_ARUDO